MARAHYIRRERGRRLQLFLKCFHFIPKSVALSAESADFLSLNGETFFPVLNRLLGHNRLRLGRRKIPL